MEWTRVGLLAAAICILSGCTPTMKEWVKERDFQYDNNYSTINKLGNRVLPDGRIERNPFLAVQGERGDLPNMTDEKNRTFNVEGQADATKFIEGVTSLSVKGDFSKVSKVVVIMNRPYTERVTTWVPKGPGQRHVAISETLNAGDMSLRLEDSTGGNITTNFTPSGNPVDAKLEFSGAARELLTISGQNFYLGYKTVERPCTKVSEKTLTLQKSKQTSDKELGIDAIFLDSRTGADGIPEVLVYLAPIPQARPIQSLGLPISDSANPNRNLQWKLGAVQSISSLRGSDGASPNGNLQLWSSIVGTNAAFRETAWEKATTVSKDEPDGFVWRAEGVLLRAKFGSGFGLSTGTDGLYVRIGPVENDKLTIDGERMILSQ